MKNDRVFSSEIKAHDLAHKVIPKAKTTATERVLSTLPEMVDYEGGYSREARFGPGEVKTGTAVMQPKKYSISESDQRRCSRRRTRRRRG